MTPPDPDPAAAGDESGDGSGDDLTLIRGVGPEIARRLRDGGVRTYADLADLDPDDIAALVAARGLTAAGIARADWRGQAAELAAADESGQRYEAFVVRILLGHGTRDGVHSTTVQHVRTGEARRWPRWAADAVTGFIEARAVATGLPAAEPPPTEPTEPPAAPTEPPTEPPTELPTATAPPAALPYSLRVEPLPAPRADQPFTVFLRLDLARWPGAGADGSDEVDDSAQVDDSAGFDYSAVVAVKPLDGRDGPTVARATGALDPRAPTVAVACAGLPAGPYRVDAAIRLRERGPAGHFRHPPAVDRGQLIEVGTA